MAESHPLLARTLHGLWCPILTPVADDLVPDQTLFIDQAKQLLDQGCHGLSPFGTTGEATSFSVTERKTMLEALFEAEIAGDQLIPGTGLCALTETIDLTKHATAAGCKAVLMLPPFYYKGLSDDALYRAFAEVFDRVNDPRLKVVLYHIPPVSQVGLSVDLVGRLMADYPEVVIGLKDSSGDFSQTEAFINAHPDLHVFPGSEVFLTDGLRRGGVGCITATANVNATAIRSVFDAFVAEDGNLDDLQAEITRYRKTVQGYAPIPAMKRMLAEQRGPANWTRTRPPLLDLPDEKWTEMSAALAALN